jgi:hypothetical protein
MTHRDDCSVATDHIQTALEAICGALITLESICSQSARAPIPGRMLRTQLTRAIESLRQATAELRLARDEEQSVLGLGFVLAPTRGRSGGGSRGSRHPSPRRTA